LEVCEAPFATACRRNLPVGRPTPSNLSVETLVCFLIWLVIGMVIYLWYGRRNARPATRDQSSTVPPVRQ
jgi:uncharacterized iron-regulated membrane protein